MPVLVAASPLVVILLPNLLECSFRTMLGKDRFGQPEVASSLLIAISSSVLSHLLTITW